MSRPTVHRARDPDARPTEPCAACGWRYWRLWSEEATSADGTSRVTWWWICNHCRPLVIHNPDGTVWRSDHPPLPPGVEPVVLAEPGAAQETKDAHHDEVPEFLR